MVGPEVGEAQGPMRDAMSVGREAIMLTTAEAEVVQEGVGDPGRDPDPCPTDAERPVEAGVAAGPGHARGHQSQGMATVAAKPLIDPGHDRHHVEGPHPNPRHDIMTRLSTTEISRNTLLYHRS